MIKTKVLSLNKSLNKLYKNIQNLWLISTNNKIKKIKYKKIKIKKIKYKKNKINKNKTINPLNPKVLFLNLLIILRINCLFSLTNCQLSQINPKINLLNIKNQHFSHPRKNQLKTKKVHKSNPNQKKKSQLLLLKFNNNNNSNLNSNI